MVFSEGVITSQDVLVVVMRIDLPSATIVKNFRNHSEHLHLQKKKLRLREKEEDLSKLT